MKPVSILIIVLLLISSCTKEKVINCRIETSEGNIDIELYQERAPITVNNFLKYVEKDLYKGSRFFRVCTAENEKERDIKIEVIQGGEIPEEQCFDPIILETTDQTKLHHLNGTISMARDKPNSATSQFFICINDQAELDFKGKRNPDGQGFAAFGKVTNGMEVVRRIQQKKETNQMLTKPVLIQTIKEISN